MHVFHKNSSYLSNFRLESDGNLEHERQFLVQEQKLCKTRARKFSLETTRRRKALDERRKLWDVQEKRLREKILQQRRQKVQEATERFQRAHLPPSQRYRQTLRRDAPNIEDALSQIQGTLSSGAEQSSLLSSTTNISSSTPSPPPLAAPKISQRQALSAVETYAKLLQEQCRIAKLQDLQGSHDSDCCISESLSSKDSLEDEDSNQKTSNLQHSGSLFLLNSEKAHSEQKKQNDLCPASVSFSAMMLLDENLTRLRKLHEPSREEREDADWTNNGTVVSEAFWDFTSLDRTPKTENCPAPHNNDLLAPCKLSKEDQDYYGVKSYQNNHNDSNLVTNRVVLGNPGESPYSKQAAPLNLREQRIHDDGQLKYPSSTDVPFPSKNRSSKGILFETPPKTKTDNKVTNNGVLLPTEKENYVSSQKMPRASINDLNKVSNSECKPESAESLLNACLSKIPSERHASPEESKTNVPVSVTTPLPVCKIKAIKGILKKQSKYMPIDTSCTRGSDYLSFAKHIALSLIDSVELTRAKTKGVQVHSTVRKKLRWFDEVRTGEDHQPSLTKESSSHNMTPASSTGYRFTKEAWADVGVQVNLSQEQADGVKVAHSSAENGGPRVPPRARSSRTGGGPVFLRTRRGAVIRPQSATEVNQIAKARGKIMAPRPPPRTQPVEEKTLHVVKTPHGPNPAGIKYKQAPVREEALPRNDSGRIFSPKTHDVITTDSTVVYTTLPHCFLSEGDTKGVPISGHQEFHHNSVGEKGLCLDVTPTDEEISQLWHGVCSALNTKDDKPTFKSQALEGRQASQKASPGQSRQPPGSLNRRLLQTSQPSKRTTELLRACSGTHYTPLNEGFETTALLAPEGLLKEGPAAGGAVEAFQTPASGGEQQQGITTISLEEKKILLSLEKLNQQLFYLQEHRGHETGTRGLTIIDAPLTKEMKSTDSSKHHTVLYPKKI